MADPRARQRTIEAIASAFELTPREAVADAVVAWTWTHTTRDLLAALQARHRWDASMPPVYLEHLRHIGLTPD